MCILLSVFALWPWQASMSAENDVIGMRLGEIDFRGSPAFRLVIETNKPLNAQLLLLNDPWRLVIDSAGLNWNVSGLGHLEHYLVAWLQLTALVSQKLEQDELLLK